jgi:hypothetical protein
LYSSPNKIRRIRSRRVRWTGQVTSMGEKGNAYRVLVWGPDGKRPPERPTLRWKDNIKLDLRERGWVDNVTYFWLAWLIITGSGSDDWIYWHFGYNYTYFQSLMTAHNRWLPKVRSVSSWTTSDFSSTVSG